jgi:hypothetical protein
MTPAQHLEAMAGFAEQLQIAKQSGVLERLYQRDDVYPRIGGKGFRLVSLDDNAPLYGFAKHPVKQPSSLLKHLERKPPFSSAEREERRIQAWIIRHAFRANGDLIGVLQVPSNQFAKLQFALDEVSPQDGIRSDVIAVGERAGINVPVVIELKFNRDKTRLFEQLDGFCRIVRENECAFSRLLRAITGLDVDCSSPKQILVWPSPKGQEAAETAKALLGRDLLEVKYTIPGDSIENTRFQVGHSGLR